MNIYEKFCLVCLEKTYNGHGYCSIDCLKKHLLKKFKEEEGNIEERNQFHRNCKLCGKRFITVNGNSFFCNHECATMYVYKEYTCEKQTSLKESSCRNCGNITFGRSYRKFCNASCNDSFFRKKHEEKRAAEPKKKKRGKSPEELMAIEDRKEKKRLFNDSIANAYIKTGKGFNL